jgi:hypothetical protein
LTTLQIHALPHVEENMSESHSKRRLGVCGYHKKPHASSESRVSAETDGASGDTPTVNRRE